MIVEEVGILHGVNFKLFKVYNMGSNFNIFIIMRIVTRQGENGPLLCTHLEM